ncbi:lantibiotic dehydratase [Streptomyces sp. NPDC046876]|uniref:lantibiotic dehydratase n=1 Tax=Streptomyces sp. NPDC046876 TaxID=3155616 RepID=UPI003407B27C
MPHPAQPAAPPRVAPARTAPYVLVRTTVAAHPAEPAEAARVRTLIARLAGLAAREAALRPALCDDLFASRGGHPEEFHRQVVLPLRRALHNGRSPRPALLARLGDLPARVPRLGDWLALHESRAAVLAGLAEATPAALAAERAALAELCRSPGFARAVALTSADLLRAVSRAAREEGGRRARKEEPSVLRHALRASTKTSPLSWFTAVGWSDGTATTAARATEDTPAAPDGTVHDTAAADETTRPRPSVPLTDPVPPAATVSPVGPVPPVGQTPAAGPTPAAALVPPVSADSPVGPVPPAASGPSADAISPTGPVPAVEPVPPSASVPSAEAVWPEGPPPLAGPVPPRGTMPAAGPVPEVEPVPSAASGPSADAVAPTGTAPLVGPGPAGGTVLPVGSGAAGAGLRGVVRENRALVAALSAALLDEPRRRRALPHRLTSSARPTADGRARYVRDRTVFAGGRYLVTHEEELELAARPALASLTGIAATPAPLDALAARLAPVLGRPAADPEVGRFVGRLADSGLLVPVEPVAPQDPAPLRALARWLRQWPEDTGLADRIDRLAADTARFAHARAEARPGLLDGLAERWRALLADAGRPVPADAAPLNVLSEDVVAAGPAPAEPGVRGDGRPATASAGSLSRADRDALGEVAGLAELFDLGHWMRRAALERFVARYGPGGTCPAAWEFGADTAAAWEEAAHLAGRPSGDPGLSEELGRLARLREEFVRQVRAGAPAGPAQEVVLPRDAVCGLAARLPGWTAARPLSYSWFVQRAVPAGRVGGDGDGDDGEGDGDDLLCVNHVYGGWGRFTSRFLDDLPPGAAAEVAREIRRGLGDGARAAQIRPVGGFNANLHPLLTGEELGPDRYWSALAEADLELAHEPASDQLRLRLRATGEPLDVLYLGFLAPVMLPQRLAPFLCDHPGGVVDFRPLLPRRAVAAPGGEVVTTPRLRHRHLVLARRRWHLPEGVLAALRAELAADPGEVPAAAAARWRALLGLPEQLFLHPVPEPPAGRAVEDFVRSLRAPKPQALDLGSALHLRCLAGWLARHPRGVVLEEALPVFGGRGQRARAVELVAETYRPARPAPPVDRRGGIR